MADPTPAFGALGNDAPMADVNELLGKAEAMLSSGDFDRVFETASGLCDAPLGRRLACAYLKRTLAHPETLDPRNQARRCNCDGGWRERTDGKVHPCPDCNARQFRRWRIAPNGSHLDHRLDKAQTSRCTECSDVLGLGVNTSSTEAWT